MRRRRERDEVLPPPAHERLAAWRAARTAVPVARVTDGADWYAAYRASTDAHAARVLARLRQEQGALRQQLEVVTDQRWQAAQEGRR